MNINNIEFDIKIQPDIESAIDAAQQICILGEKIGVADDKKTECVEDIVRYIREVYTAALIESEALNVRNATTSTSAQSNTIDSTVLEAEISP